MKNIGIGDKLRKLRNAYGLSQTQFADKIGLSRASVNSYENNINPIPDGIKWKIEQAIGIKSEYFDTDMDLAQAFFKFGVDPRKEINTGAINETICTFYDDFESFSKNRYEIEPFSERIIILKQFFGLNEALEYAFIKVHQNKGYPFASNDDILIVVPHNKPKNNSLMVVSINDEIYLKFCRINPVTQNIKLMSSKDDFSNIDLENSNIEKVKFLGFVVNIFKNFQPEILF